MFKKIFLIISALFFLIGLFFLKPVLAISMRLTEEQVKEAVVHGQDNKNKDFVDFSKSWTVSLGEGEGFATLFTPYHNIAYKAKKFAVERKKLSNRDIKAALEIGDYLTFTATVYGDVFNFAVFQTAKLLQKDKVIKPIYQFKPDISDASKFWPESPRHMARLVFKFPYNNIDLNSPVTLVVFDPQGKEVEFTFKLSQMK